MKKNNPKISVVIPAHNEEELIGRAIDSVLANKYSNKEIIVVNDGSTDKTPEIVKSYMELNNSIKLINFEEGHSAAFARNKGTEKVKGDIIIFLDADTIINDIFLEEIAKFKDVAQGFITLNFPLRTTWVNKILSGMVGPSIKRNLDDGTVYDGESSSEAGDMFFAITKKAFDDIKGYGEDKFYFEDDYFARKFYKKGYKSVFVKNAEQYFELPSTLTEFFRQCKWIAKGTNTINEYQDRMRKKTIWFSKLVFILSPLLLMFNPTLMLYWFLTTLLVTYLSLVKRNKKPFLSLLVVPFVYLKTLLVVYNLLKN
jgi:glycosyltransferase involved in cell wall biosynthesis